MEEELHILLVEDDLESGEALKMMLERRGVEVTLCESAEAALDLFDAEAFDAVVADIRLGGQSGVDVLKRIRDDSDEFPVILLTGYDSLESAVQAVRLGAQDYILKPLSGIEDLLVPTVKAVKGHRLFMQNHELREGLRSLASRLETVREEERANVARAIHDELGQSLTALKMGLAWLDKRLADDQLALQERIESMVQLSDEMIKVVQRISSELRPAVLDDLGIEAAIEWQSEEFEKRSGIPCACIVSLENDDIDMVVATAIFRVVQEALTNVMRHAEATGVAISLHEGNGSAVVEVSDDGRGIESEDIESTSSLGLLGMKERALALGGEAVIRVEEGKGTTVTMTVPLSVERGEL